MDGLEKLIKQKSDLNSNTINSVLNTKALNLHFRATYSQCTIKVECYQRHLGSISQHCAAARTLLVFSKPTLPELHQIATGHRNRAFVIRFLQRWKTFPIIRGPFHANNAVAGDALGVLIFAKNRTTHCGLGLGRQKREITKCGEN